MNNQKGSATVVLLVVLVVILAGVLVYFGFFKKPVEVAVSPTPTDVTAGWKIYRNEQFGFEIKYPADWKVKINGQYIIIDSPDYRGNAISSSVIEVVVTGSRIVINRFSNPANQELDVFFEDYSRKNNQKSFEIDGHTAQSIDTVVEFGVNETVVMISKDLFVYEILRTYESGKKDLDQKVFDQILSTFKFIEPKSRGSTSEWQTYRNDKYELEVKLPNGWEVLDSNPAGSGLDVVMRDRKYARSWEWPGLRLTTLPDVINEFVGAKPSKIFNAAEAKDEVVRIYFYESGKKVYAACTLYLEPTIIGYCNQILSTFKFTSTP